MVKIEPNMTIKGTVYPVVEMGLCKRAEEMFELTLSCRTLSLEDIYGGKICAALDRQHPRDLFDVKLKTNDYSILHRIPASPLCFYKPRLLQIKRYSRF
ncbi:MAG: nucleotidyl transferase AbiEii/AbiGii toxin family protein, partial [Ignavibacteriaceae bacterium]|nr:nucleotidyl transferase AbiEii/AbiGii toxin family protein [Ignavibacteriaceae bacterium]